MDSVISEQRGNYFIKKWQLFQLLIEILNMKWKIVMDIVLYTIADECKNKI